MKGLTAETMTTSTLTTGHSLAARRERRNERRPLDGVRKQNTKTKKRNISRNISQSVIDTTSFFNTVLDPDNYLSKLLKLNSMVNLHHSLEAKDIAENTPESRVLTMCDKTCFLPFVMFGDGATHGEEEDGETKKVNQMKRIR
ncbi:hypothetical protein GmHk_18G051448 [Glycine max]|nr:hypothetical protein GmHk_18G051448 [Glycine max]